MNQKVHNQIVSFIWGIADDVLRDVFVRGKYRDIILPFTVLRRLDALLVPTKKEVLENNQFLIKPFTINHYLTPSKIITNSPRGEFFLKCSQASAKLPRKNSS